MSRHSLCLWLTLSCVILVAAPALSKERFILGQFCDDLNYLAQQRDFYAVIGGIGLTPTLLGSAFRQESPEFTELWGPSVFADGFFEAGEGMGEALYPVSVSTALWTVGRLSHSRSLGDLGSDLLRAQAINGLVTLSLKAAINRRRPNGAPYSYPSGHTTSAFTIAGVIYRDCGRSWGIPAFVLASYVGLSRLQEGTHYLSDVIAGAIVGSYLGLKIAGREQGSGSVNLQPMLSPNSAGMMVSVGF